MYRAIYERRDATLFTQEPVSDEILARLLDAAHHAPSVGLMQPWRFIVIRDVSVRRAAHEAFTRASRLAAGIYDEEHRALYRSMKLEGILEAPVNLCVVCDPTTERGHGLGRQTMPETCAYSTVCAVQNLWLAARAEGIGVRTLVVQLHRDADHVVAGFGQKAGGDGRIHASRHRHHHAHGLAHRLQRLADPAQLRDQFGYARDDKVDLAIGGARTEAESDGIPRARVRQSHPTQHVRRLQRA